MRKVFVVMFCVLALTVGLMAGKNADCDRMGMDNCKRFDYDIEQAFTHYGPIGVKVDLLSVTGRPLSEKLGYCCEVMLRVAPVVPNPIASADIWHYCGCLIYKTTGQVPVGIRIIDKDKLIGCCKAAEKIPVKLPKDLFTVNLYWVLYPKCLEPFYVFTYKELHFTVGAYTGKLYK